MASVFVLLEAFNRKEAAALGFFPCATASFCIILKGRPAFGSALSIYKMPRPSVKVNPPPPGRTAAPVVTRSRPH